VARAAISAAGVVPCKLLGYVGAGATYRRASAVVAAFANGLANANWDGGWDEVDVSSYPPVAGGNDFIASGLHKPIVAVLMTVDANLDSDGINSVLTLTLSLGKDASTAFQVVKMNAQAGDQADLELSMQAGELVVPTSAGTPYTGLGQKFYWKGDKTSSVGTGAVNDANFRANGYIW